MTKEISLDDALDGFKHFCAENPYTGTTQQIVTLSLGLHEAGKRLKPSAFFITLLTSITTERGVDLKSLKPVSVNHIRFAACRTHCGKLENGPG